MNTAHTCTENLFLDKSVHNRETQKHRAEVKETMLEITAKFMVRSLQNIGVRS